ncbi:BMC domain-containing protein [Paenibacillus marinisediminis]
MRASIGMIETRGLTSAWLAAEMMVKFAYVEVLKVEKSGAGYVAVIVQGDIESVRTALEVGSAEARRTGELITSHILYKPADELDVLLASE